MSSCRFVSFLVGFLFTVASPCVLAADYQVVKGGPIHEAFITEESGALILEAITESPPHAIEEQIPPQSDKLATWIPGYWTWSKEREDFLWVSGVWRRPPPDHDWVVGRWEKLPEGWVYFSGFWSTVRERSLKFIHDAPPDLLDENIPSSPGVDSFWIPGYWHFENNKYIWYAGKWESFDPNWVYVPAHYYWRETGYVLVEGYWDWPLEHRGVAYAAIAVDPHVRSVIVYEPVVILDPIYIIELYYPWFPSYICLFHHHYHYHLDFWISWGGAPCWWAWPDWWCYTWFDQWALFWWWCHPDFIHPFWMDGAFANMIAPPPNFVLKMMKNVLPPPIVTPNGVTTPEGLLDAIEDVIGEKEPILPDNADEVEEIQEEAMPKQPRRPSVRPRGTLPPAKPGPDKPHFGPNTQDLKSPPRRVRPPAKPELPSTRPPIRRVRPPVKPKVTPRTPPQVVPSRPRPRVRPQPPTEVTPRPRPQPRPRPRPQTRPRPTPRPRPEARPRPQPSYPRKPERPYRPTPPPSYQPEVQPRQPYQPRTPEFSPPRTKTPSPKYQPSTPRKKGRQSEIYFNSHYHAPQQGMDPNHSWPPTPNALQDKGNFMSHPMPQKNPPGLSPHHPDGFFH